MKSLVKLGLVFAVVAVVMVSGVAVTQAWGPGGSTGGPEDSLVSIAAKALGMTQLELVNVLRGGKTIADVAKEKGVALDTIVNAFVAERQTALSAAVTSGRFSQAQADTMLSFMKANVLAQLSKPFTAYGPWFGDTARSGQGMRSGERGGPRWGR